MGGATSESRFDVDEVDPGETVWFDRGFGPEKATVFVADDERIAVYVGTPNMERQMLTYKEAFPSEGALLDAQG